MPAVLGHVIVQTRLNVEVKPHSVVGHVLIFVVIAPVGLSDSGREHIASLGVHLVAVELFFWVGGDFPVLQLGVHYKVCQNRFIAVRVHVDD